MTLEKRLLLLLALSLCLASTQRTLEEVLVQAGFNVHKVEGHWFTIELASNHPGLVSPEDPLRLALYSIQVREHGDLEFVLFWKVLSVGQASASLDLPPVTGGSLHVLFVGSDDSNLILCVRFEDDEVTSLWALLARSETGDPAWLRRYLEYVETVHLQNAPVSNTAGPSWRQPCGARATPSGTVEPGIRDYQRVHAPHMAKAAAAVVQSPPTLAELSQYLFRLK
ncbi:beta-lactoglobulin [Ctenodactylus gundi]